MLIGRYLFLFIDTLQHILEPEIACGRVSYI